MATNQSSAAADTATSDTAATETSDAPAAPAPQTTSPLLSAQVSGGQIIVSGAGFQPGDRLSIEFTRPDGRIDPTVAIADEDGRLTSYARNYTEGKHQVTAKRADGSVVASSKFSV